MRPPLSLLQGKQTEVSLSRCPNSGLQLLPPVPGPPLSLGTLWAVAIQSCSTLPVLGFTAPQALLTLTSLTCRCWLMSDRTSAFKLHVGQMQLQHWSPTVLGSTIATCKHCCTWANIYGSISCSSLLLDISESTVWAPVTDTQKGSQWELPEWVWFRHATFSRLERTWHGVKPLTTAAPLC